MKNQLDRPAATCVAVKDSLPDIPHYLQAHYWWAYVHPRAVHIFERQWLVNLILWGNYKRLCNAVLHDYGHDLGGRTLQIACAYGDLTPRLVDCVAPGGSLEIADILPIQLENLAKKLPKDAPVQLHCMDSAALGFADASFDRALLFFLLHEQPQAVREKNARRGAAGGASGWHADHRRLRAAQQNESHALPLEAGPRPARALCARPVQ
ncbi:rhodoquinone biosynthesis methyltransferase RquA [Candidatus Accumulibacter phosphatis]|uniref:rhodoquinone biosynthesis methyltransferase RquA n=1 Tax=Candidatus Accumulibacter phosphatis TaxID=327160 RepID=UPI0020BE430B|nr:rhodoquinone biosynthesis methyltransferase RquA [Candidatus Accumulibacter phosphatis]